MISNTKTQAFNFPKTNENYKISSKFYLRLKSYLVWMRDMKLKSLAGCGSHTCNSRQGKKVWGEDSQGWTVRLSGNSTLPEAVEQAQLSHRQQSGVDLNTYFCVINCAPQMS